ncbi:MAG: Stk1 family PASTA domain-containing Ser/Thr kinase [Clostridiales bacterium]|nr:Stk1 family PASTA domain-containing Ser/Thr kinase [Clostridiales bacterium]
MNLEGKILGGRYELIEKIGNGGMATVYRAKCHVLKRDVAVKILRDEFTTDEEFIKRFNIEAQAIACFTHPNIVSVYDVGQEGNLHYIVMELVKGKTLKEIIVEDGKLGWRWSLKVATQIASALESAHKKNIIHRDIKPHNIIITEDGVAKVTDFGIAKAVSNSTMTAFGTTIGSVHYFSPEHARGSITDAKSDLYSLGVVMYEMVTGKVPFDADTPVSVALKHMQEEPVPPSTINPDLPSSVNDIILKALQKDANQRYNSATEMINDLNNALKNPDGKFVNKLSTGFLDETKKIDISEIQKGNNRHAKEPEKKKGKESKMNQYFEKHPIVKVAAMTLIALLVLIVTFLIATLIMNIGDSEPIQIPDFVGKTLEEAEKEASELKIKVEKIEEKYDKEIEKGKIISQEPKYQDKFTILEDSTIKVIVSLGQEIVKVPKVIGLKKDEATKALKKVKLSVKIEEEFSDEVEEGYVIKQQYQENEEIMAGEEILITVSSGIEQVTVPNLLGKTETEAKKAISDAKLKWKSTSKTSDSSKANGVVVSQSITANSVVDKETEITITVNEFEEIKSGTININVKSLIGYETLYDAEGNEVPAESVNLVVEVDGEQVDSRTVSKASTNESIRIDAKGTVTVKVKIDGSKKAERSFNLNDGTITID